jgi:hypothetical protein
LVHKHSRKYELSCKECKDPWDRSDRKYTGPSLTKVDKCLKYLFAAFESTATLALILPTTARASDPGGSWRDFATGSHSGYMLKVADIGCIPGTGAHMS